MELITNSKIGFCHYPGFSLLFDNPGGAHNLSSMGTHYQKMDAQVETDPALELYQALHDSVQELEFIDKISQNHLFFALPSSTYHVTVFDGFSQGHLTSRHKGLSEKCRQALKDFLIDLQYSFREKNPFLPVMQDSSLVKTNRTVTFEFDQLTNWGGNVLVARLRTPENDQASSETLAQIIEERKDLSQFFAQTFYEECIGMDEKISIYTPHVSLGYFGNIEKGKVAQAETERWTDFFRRRLRNKTITFTSISLYGFTDMITFFKLIAAP